MNGKLRITGWVGAILALCLMISGCGLLPTTRVGETVTDTQTLELGAADAVRVQVNMAAGVLAIAGDADSLMDATFRYNVASWKPHIEYRINGSRGELIVDHAGKRIPVGGTLINEWNLLLSNTVPIDLEIVTGASESNLDFRGLDLAGLRIDIGAGSTEVDLSSALNHDLEVTINGGVGDLSVKLPSDMGVKVSADSAIGGLTNSGLKRDGDTYINQAYGSSPHTLFVKVSAGVGSVNLIIP